MAINSPEAQREADIRKRRKEKEEKEFLELAEEAILEAQRGQPAKLAQLLLVMKKAISDSGYSQLIG